MMVDPQLEGPILIATIVLAFSGGLIAIASRLLFDFQRTRLASVLFFGAMVLVAVMTAVALGTGSSCWISGGGSLLFMSIIGTIAPGNVEAAPF